MKTLKTDEIKPLDGMRIHLVEPAAKTRSGKSLGMARARFLLLLLGLSVPCVGFSADKDVAVLKNDTGQKIIIEIVHDDDPRFAEPLYFALDQGKTIMKSDFGSFPASVFVFMKEDYERPNPDRIITLFGDRTTPLVIRINKGRITYDGDPRE